MRSAMWLNTGLAFTNCVFTLVGVWAVERMGRRALTLSSLFGVMISLLLLGTVMSFGDDALENSPVVSGGCEWPCTPPRGAERSGSPQCDCDWHEIRRDAI